MTNNIKNNAGAANVQRVTIENLEAELFNTCPDITNYEELEVYANKVGEWVLETAKTNLASLDIDDETALEEVVPADQLDSMAFTLDGRTFSAFNIFNFICPGFLVDGLDIEKWTLDDFEPAISQGLESFLSEENLDI